MPDPFDIPIFGPAWRYGFGADMRYGEVLDAMSGGHTRAAQALHGLFRHTVDDENYTGCDIWSLVHQLERYDLYDKNLGRLYDACGNDEGFAGFVVAMMYEVIEYETVWEGAAGNVKFDPNALIAIAQGCSPRFKSDLDLGEKYAAAREAGEEARRKNAGVWDFHTVERDIFVASTEPLSARTVGAVRSRLSCCASKLRIPRMI